MKGSDKDNNKKPPAHQTQAVKLGKDHLVLIFTLGYYVLSKWALDGTTRVTSGASNNKVIFFRISSFG